VSHDNLFHSVLHCAGVESEVVNPELSLCKAGAVPEYDRAILKSR